MGTEKIVEKEVDLLKLLENIEKFNEQQEEDILKITPLEEILVSNGIMDGPEEFDEEMELLIRHGYLTDEYKLTADGRRYIELYREFRQLMDKLDSLTDEQKNKKEIHLFENLKLEVNALKVGLLDKSAILTSSDAVKKIMEMLPRIKQFLS